MRFHHVVEGDPLDNHSDSKVVTGSYDCTIQGPDGRQRAQAYLRDKAYCGVCKTLGEIVVGPGTPGYNLRMYDSALPSYEAVEGDIVLCNCDRLPKLVAVYARCSYIEDRSQAPAVSSAAPGAASLAAVAKAAAADEASMEQAAYGDPRYWTAQVGSPAPGTGAPISPENHPSAKQFSEQGANMLKRAEGSMHLRPYDDQTGADVDHWVTGATIGYGHLITQEQWSRFATGISVDEGDSLFESDLQPFVDTVNASLIREVTQNQFDALVILCFNIGQGAFRQSSALKLINDAQAELSLRVSR